MCPATISASILAANMWKNSLKNEESDKNKILYETLLDFLQRNGSYFLNKPRMYVCTYVCIYVCKYVRMYACVCVRVGLHIIELREKVHLSSHKVTIHYAIQKHFIPR